MKRPARKPAQLNPAETMLRLFRDAGLSFLKVAARLNLSHSTVWRWPRTNGGIVPAQYHRDLLAFAAEHRVRLTPNDLIFGRLEW